MNQGSTGKTPGTTKLLIRVYPDSRALKNRTTQNNPDQNLDYDLYWR